MQVRLGLSNKSDNVPQNVGPSEISADLVKRTSKWAASSFDPFDDGIYCACISRNLRAFVPKLRAARRARGFGVSSARWLVFNEEKAAVRPTIAKGINAYKAELR